MEAGASLLQIYSALVFLGPQLVQDIKQDLVQTLNTTGATSLTTLIGTKSDDWAAGRM
jgi:dihydroorotate dehydrogenase